MACEARDKQSCRNSNCSTRQSQRSHSVKRHEASFSWPPSVYADREAGTQQNTERERDMLRRDKFRHDEHDREHYDAEKRECNHFLPCHDQVSRPEVNVTWTRRSVRIRRSQIPPWHLAVFMPDAVTVKILNPAS